MRHALIGRPAVALVLTLVLAACGAPESPVPSTTAPPARPNIVVVLVDDLRFDEFGAALAIGRASPLMPFAVPRFFTAAYGLAGDVPVRMALNATPDLVFATIFLWWARS